MEKGFRKVVNFLAFIAVILIGTTLLFNLIFSAKMPTLTNILMEIIKYIAIFVTCVNGYYFVRSKRSGVYMLLYLIAVIMIAVCLVIPIFKGV